MDVRSRSLDDNQHRVGRSDVSSGVRAEHGKHVVAGCQVRRGELCRRRGDGLKFLCPIVKLQLFQIREFAGLDGDGDIRPRIDGGRSRATRARRGDGQRLVMGGVGRVNKGDILILQPTRMAEITLGLAGWDDFREATIPRGVIGHPAGGRIDGDQLDGTFGHIPGPWGSACARPGPSVA